MSAADIDDLDHSVNAVARTGEDILIAAVDVDSLLAFHQVLRIADSVTQHRRLFKPHLLRRLIHLCGQAVDNLTALSAQEVDDLAHDRAVFLRRRQRRAGRKALAELMMQAWAQVHIGFHLHRAGTQREQPAQHIHHLAHAGCAHIGSKILRLILFHPPNQLNAGIILRRIDAQVGVMLIVLEQDIILRLMELDEVTFKNQGFQICVAQHDIKIIDSRNHSAYFDRMCLGMGEILADAVFEVDRFTDIDDPALAFHEITARTSRQFFNFQFEQVIHAGFLSDSAEGWSGGR